MVATTAVAINGPTPGISIRRLQFSLCRATLLICLSRPSICMPSSLSLLYWYSSTVMRYGGRFVFIRSRAVGSFLSIAVRSLWRISPNSRSVPRVLICEVLNFTSCLRERCRTRTYCFSSVLTAISLLGCCTAIQIARASITSFLLPMTNALTKRACNSRTLCPSFFQFPRPMLGASTSLHTYQTGFPVAEERQKILAT